MASMVRNDSNKKTDVEASAGHKAQKKDKPLCTRCNFHGHTIHKCYKLHCYPLGCRHKQRNHNASVNQTSVSLDHHAIQYQQSQRHEASFTNVIQGLNSERYQQLMNFLSPHLSSPIKDTTRNSSSISYTIGICLSISMNHICSSMKYWISDSGASYLFQC